MELTASVGPHWGATIVRKEAEVDRRSRSLNLVAKVDDEETSEDTLLVPGLFVRARISGKVYQNVVRIPRRALRGDHEIVLVQDDETLLRRSVPILRKTSGRAREEERDTVLVQAEALQPGDRICVSFLPNFGPESKVEVTSILTNDG